MDNLELNHEQAETKEAAPFLYPLDVPEYEVQLNVAPNRDSKPKIVEARFNRATPGQEHAREDASQSGYQDVTATEEKLIVKDQAANSNLFNQTATHVKGFRLKHEPKDAGNDWREVTKELLAAIPPEVKSAFISRARDVKARFIDDDEDCFVVGGEITLPVEVEFETGDEETPIAKVVFELPEPREDERENFLEKASEIRQSRGDKKRKTRIISNVRECLEFFDKLMLRSGANITGGTVGGKTFDQYEGKKKAAFLAGIEPHVKVKVVNVAFQRYTARLTD